MDGTHQLVDKNSKRGMYMELRTRSMFYESEIHFEGINRDDSLHSKYKAIKCDFMYERALFNGITVEKRIGFVH